MTFEISEAANECGLNQEVILQFISSEWIQPIDPNNLLLDEEDIARIQLISELREELGVNDEGVPIILHLIDQLNHLHHKLTQKMKPF
ncbi:MAG: MerR family transcriptional regulator [Bacteriovorax sp.]|nr:MerR family transcriptional regulator [Bacteriovorax sp.]